MLVGFKIEDIKTINAIKTGALSSAWGKSLLGIAPELLISDSASEYRDIFDAHQECWIHELRHYRAIKISSEYVREELDLFFKEAWDLFDLMESYKEFPNAILREKIEQDFKTIFEKEYQSFMINHCRQNTLSRKESLLTFLHFPAIAIHNNQADSGNLWISLYQTVRKNGVSFFHYLQDRFKEINHIPQLSIIIENRA